LGAHSKFVSQGRQNPLSQTGTLGAHSKFVSQGRQSPLSQTGSAGDMHCASDVHSGVVGGTHLPRSRSHTSGVQCTLLVHSTQMSRNESQMGGSVQRGKPEPQYGAQ
jgi:hypothetical protein